MAGPYEGVVRFVRNKKYKFQLNRMGGFTIKTFKLVSLEVVEDENTSIGVPLDHGVIINKEDDHSTWLIEAYSKIGLYDYFKKISDEKREIIIRVVITKENNDPVYLQTKISCLQLFNDHISVLLEGGMRQAKSGYSEIVLENLIKMGLTGDVLLEEFRKKKHSVPRLK